MLVERKIHGSRMLLDTDDPGLSRQLLEKGTREGDCPNILERLVKPGWLCLEVGANLGFYALIEAAKGATVYAIEANPRNARILQRNADLNGYAGIHVFNCAAGNKNGRAEFMLSNRSNCGYMVDMTAVRRRGIKKITVDEVRLDDFIRREKMGSIDFLRCDIDGYEPEMIAGAQETLEAMPVGSWIFCELHPRCFDHPMKDLRPAVQSIIDHGFKPCKGVGPGKYLVKYPAEDFARACCEEYADTAPLVFLEKR